MELRHLRYFLMIAETENVRRASERLHIAQPAVSRQLHDLEQELGIELFERLPRGLRLNAAGHAYQADVIRIFEMLAEAEDRARRVASGEAGMLRLGYLDVVGWRGAVPHVLQDFATAHPDIRMELVPMNSPQQIELIEEGKLDGGFVYPIDPLASTLTALPIRSGSVVLAYPVAWSDRMADGMRLRDLAPMPFISFPRREYPAYYDRLFAALHAGGLTPKIVQEEANETAILSLVSAGVGVAIVNDANMDRPPPLVKFARVPDLFVPLDLNFAYRSDNSNPSLAVFTSSIGDSLNSAN